jgi:hypothetical protein
LTSALDCSGSGISAKRVGQSRAARRPYPCFITDFVRLLGSVNFRRIHSLIRQS